MSDIPNLDARIAAMQAEYSAQIAGLVNRCALLASELASVKADLAIAKDDPTKTPP